MNGRNMLCVEDARLVYQNFSGREGRYNPAGDKNFVIGFSEQDLVAGGLSVNGLIEEGWNVKPSKRDNRNEYDDQEFTLAVAISNEYFPMIQMHNGRVGKRLDEKSVTQLDKIEIETADLIMSPYRWEISGNVGIKAYVYQLFVMMGKSPFSTKWDDAPEEVPWDEA